MESSAARFWESRRINFVLSRPREIDKHINKSIHLLGLLSLSFVENARRINSVYVLRFSSRSNSKSTSQLNTFIYVFINSAYSSLGGPFRGGKASTHSRVLIKNVHRTFLPRLRSARNYCADIPQNLALGSRAVGGKS